jgi:hypothetical protein
VRSTSLPRWRVALESPHRDGCPPVLFTASDSDTLAVVALDMLLIGLVVVDASSCGAICVCC